MGHHLRAIRRLVILLSVYAAAVMLCGQAWGAYRENVEARQRIEQNQEDYERKLAELTRLLDEQQRLDTDTETQIGLLKEKLGYCEPGEIPIVIVDKSADGA